MKRRIEEYLKEKGYQVELQEAGIATTHDYMGREYRVLGEVCNGFPFTLPRLILLDRSRWGALAHVTWCKTDNKGLICTGVAISMNIDYNSPELVYEKCLLEGLKTLEQSFKDDDVNKQEIIEEFNAHWRDLANKKILNFVEPSDSVKSIKVFQKKSGLTYAIDYENGINSKFPYLVDKKVKSQLIGQGIYLPLDKGLLPPRVDGTLKKWWKGVLNEFPSIKGDIKSLIREKQAKIFWIVGSVKVKDNLSWFILKFESKKKGKLPLGKRDDFNLWDIKAYDVELHNKEYMLPRGGASRSEKKNNILLVGCGSVGGEIAMNIASSGLVGRITLMDMDKMGIENTYRHALGGKYIGKPKITALKTELMEKYPYIDVDYNPSLNENYLKDALKDGFLDDYSGVIVATGDPTVERYFNEEILKREKRPWVIYSWLEGHGVGGHGIYVHNEKKGCLACLYRDSSGAKSLHSIQNFLAGDQAVAIDISGCGSNFLPYSNLDAKETAILATRLALKAMTGELEESKRISWKGELNPDLGLETTRRYEEKGNNCLKLLPLYWNGCDICNG